MFTVWEFRRTTCFEIAVCIEYYHISIIRNHILRSNDVTIEVKTLATDTVKLYIEKSN